MSTHDSRHMKDAVINAEDTEDRFRILCEATFEGVAIHDKGLILDANKAFADMLGYEVNEVIGKMATDFLVPESHDVVMTNILSGYEKPYEATALRKDGSALPIEINGRPISYGGKRVRVTAIRDISDRKKAEKARKEIDLLTEALLNASLDIAILVDINENIVALNEAAAKSLGKSRQQLLGTNIFHGLEPALRKLRVKKGKELLRTGKPLRFEDERNGIFFDNHIYPITDDQGNVVRVAVFARDITEQKQAQEALRLSEEKYRVLVEASPDFIFLHDREGHYLYMNQTGLKYLNTTPDDIIGKGVEDIFPAEKAQWMKECILQVVQQNKIISIEYDIVKENEIRYIRTTLAPVQNADGDVISIIGIARDITDRKRAEKTVEELRELTQALINASRDIVILIDTDGTIVALNNAAAKSIRLNRHQLIGTNIFKSEKAIFTTLRTAKTKEAIRSGKEVHFEDERRGVWFDNIVYPVFDDCGNISRVAVFARDITELKRTEKALRSSEEKWRSLVENAPNVVTLVGRDMKVLFVNRTPSKIQIENPIGKHVSCFCSPEYHSTVVEHLTHVFETGTATTFDTTIPSEPESFWYRHRAGPVKQNGRVVSAIIISADITQQIRTEQALRESEETYRSLVETFPDAVIAADLDGNITYVSARTVEMRGSEQPEDLLGNNVLDQIAPEDHERAISNITKTLQIGSVRNLEYTMLREDGSRFIGELNATLIKDAHDRPKSYLATVRDVTERNKIESQLKESEEKFRNLAEKSPNMIFINCRGKILYVNDMCEDVMGYTKEEFYSPDFDFLSISTPEYRDMLKENHQKHLDGEEVDPIEYVLITKTGKRIAAILTTKLITYGGESSILGIVTDITDRKLAEEKMKNYSEELEKEVKARTVRIQELERQRAESEKLAATGRMAARIAHEINNPLAGIKNSFRLVKDAIPKQHDYFDYVERIDKEIERIASIVRRPFDLYRPGQELAREVSVNEIIRDMVVLLEPSCEAHHVNIVTDTQEDPMNVVIQSGYLTQVLYNLIHNAIEASPKDEEVRVSARLDNQHLILDIMDQGHGIPQEIRSQIFEPFITTKSQEILGGLGLGLAVSKGMVDAMGGRIEFDSEVGKGTTFHIVIPITEVRKGLQNG